MKAWSSVVTAPAVNFWPPALIVMSKSTSGSLSSPWLWKGPVSFSEIGPSSWDAAAPVASSLAAQVQVDLAAVDLLLPAEGLVDELLGALVGAAARRRRMRPRTSAGTTRASASSSGRRLRRRADKADLPFDGRAVTPACLQECVRPALAGKTKVNIQDAPSPMRWSGHITSQPLPGRRRRGRGRRSRVACRMPAAPAAGARKPDPVRTTIDRALAAGAIDAEQRAGYLASYSAARRTLSGALGTAAGRARLRPRHAALVRAPEAPHGPPAARCS